MSFNLINIANENGFQSMDFVAISISFVSLITTILFAILSYRQNAKFKDIDLEAGFIKELFEKYFVKMIPEQREKIRCGANGYLELDNHLCNTLNDIRREFEYFKFLDYAFYRELGSQVHDIDDLLVKSHNHRLDDSSDVQDLFDRLDSKLKKLYRLVSRKYHGKKHLPYFLSPSA